MGEDECLMLTVAGALVALLICVAAVWVAGNAGTAVALGPPNRSVLAQLGRPARAFPMGGAEGGQTPRPIPPGDWGWFVDWGDGALHHCTECSSYPQADGTYLLGVGYCADLAQPRLGAVTARWFRCSSAAWRIEEVVKRWRVSTDTIGSCSGRCRR